LKKSYQNPSRFSNPVPTIGFEVKLEHGLPLHIEPLMHGLQSCSKKGIKDAATETTE
jgi:hypothetical protein